MGEWVCVSDTCHHGGELVGYIGIGVLCVEMLTGGCCQCSSLVSGLVWVMFSYVVITEYVVIGWVGGMFDSRYLEILGCNQWTGLVLFVMCYVRFSMVCICRTLWLLICIFGLGG